MLKSVLSVAAFCGLSLLFVACSSKPLYQVTALSSDAHRLAFSQSKPMGCMLVGEKEGIARIGETSATMEMMRESAKNDLLNKSAYLVEVGSSKRLVVYHAAEIWNCKAEKGFMNSLTGGANDNPEIPCPGNNFDVKEVSSLRVKGEIYECKF